MCVERIIDSHYSARISDPHVILRGTAEDICPFFSTCNSAWFAHICLQPLKLKLGTGQILNSIE